MLWAKSLPRCNCYNFLGWSTTSLQTSQMNKRRSWLSTTQPFYFARTGINNIFIFSELCWKILLKFFWESVEKSQGTASEHPNYICLRPALTFERLGAQRKGKCCSKTYDYAFVARLIFLVCHGCSNLTFFTFQKCLIWANDDHIRYLLFSDQPWIECALNIQLPPLPSSRCPGTSLQPWTPTGRLSIEVMVF